MQRSDIKYLTLDDPISGSKLTRASFWNQEKRNKDYVQDLLHIIQKILSLQLSDNPLSRENKGIESTVLYNEESNYQMNSKPLFVGAPHWKRMWLPLSTPQQLQHQQDQPQPTKATLFVDWKDPSNLQQY